MAGEIDGGCENVPDDSFGIDDKSDALRDEAEQFVYAIALPDRAAFIGEECKAELVFGGEAGVGVRGIVADAKDDGSSGFEFRGFITEAAGFDGSASGVVFRVEENNHRPAAEMAEPDGVAVLIRKFKVWCGSACG